MSADGELGKPVSNEIRLVWGLRAIGQVAGGLNRFQVHWLIKNGKLKTRIVGRRHLTTVDQIHRDLLADEK